MVKGGAFAFIFISALGVASAAQAETVTFSCEGEEAQNFDGREPSQGNWTIDVDYSASRLKIADYPFVPVVITDREISVQMELSWGGGTLHVFSRIDRLAGTMMARIGWREAGIGPSRYYRGRCRPATTTRI
jgi:hypothetical protein